MSDRDLLKLSIPIEPRIDALVYLPQPMTEARWEQFMDVLNAMKPGIVREPVAGRGAADGGDHDG